MHTHKAQITKNSFTGGKNSFIFVLVDCVLFLKGPSIYSIEYSEKEYLFSGAFFGFFRVQMQASQFQYYKHFFNSVCGNKGLCNHKHPCINLTPT